MLHKILVVGDIILDINYFTVTKRKAPEADIPIYNVVQQESILGGCAQVAKTLKLMDNNIELISVLGDDEYGKQIQNLLKNKQIESKLFIDPHRKTTQKHRTFFSNSFDGKPSHTSSPPTTSLITQFTPNHLVNRLDIEDVVSINSNLETEIFEYIKKKTDLDAVILSDYNKGVLTLSLCRNIIQYCNEKNILTFVDPKLDDVSKYQNCFCFKPNMLEAKQITDANKTGEIFKSLYKTIFPKNIIITDSNKGVYVNNSRNIISGKNDVNVVDVTGAGDVFIAVLVSCFLQNRNILSSSKIAQFIASKSVEYIGNYDFQQRHLNEYELLEKQVFYENDFESIQFMRSLYSKIIFTNGCFDVFHSAHLQLLRFCKEQNGIVILGLNSDTSIQRLKGKKRPINSIHERVNLLKNLPYVDFIIIFDEETPLNILKYLKPNIMVKGSEYKIEDIVGQNDCEEVKLFPYISGISTTHIVNRISDKQS